MYITYIKSIITIESNHTVDISRFFTNMVDFFSCLSVSSRAFFSSSKNRGHVFKKISTTWLLYTERERERGYVTKGSC